VQDSDSQLTFAYDSAGRLLNNTVGDAANPALAQVATSIEYGYDANGNRRSMSCAQCISPGFVASGYFYDGLNRLIGVSAHNLVGVDFSYDALSRLTRMSGGPVRTFSYDDASQLRSITTTLLGNPLESFGYTYDRLGNRLSLTDRLGLHQVGYDALNRLTSVDHPLASGLVDEAFTYDPVGNRTSSHLSALHRYEAANRLLEDDQFLYTYDENGNLIQKREKATGATTTYTYNVENQLIQIDLPDGRIARYRYDGLGRRIEKNVAGAITRYLYDQEDIVALFAGPTNCQTHAFLHGPGIDQPLAFVKDTNNDCNPFSDAVGLREPIVYLQSDGLGSTTSLVSETGGFFRGLFLAERVTYDSFGMPTITGPGPDNQMDTADDVILPESAFGNIYFFTGREFDPESGLYYNRHRYWDPHTGRFLQEDPIGFLSGEVNFYSYVGSVGKPLLETNLYLYAGNNPVNFTDPFGEQPVGIGIGLPPLPGVDIPLPDPFTDKTDPTVCPVESEDEGEEVVCTLVDQSEEICQYRCSDGGFVNLNRRRLGGVSAGDPASSLRTERMRDD